VRAGSEIIVPETLEAAVRQNKLWDITPDQWFNEYLPGDEENDRQARRVSFGGINSNGSVRVPMTAINSNDDIVRMMFENGLIKDDRVSQAVRRKYFAAPGSFTPTKEMIPEPEPDTYLPDEFDAALDAAVSMTYPRPVTSAKRSAAKTTIREKRVPDFKSIKLDWLQDKPVEPQIQVQFSSDIGDFETYYHRIFESEAILYFAFDKRCKFGRFTPKMGGGAVTVTVNDTPYHGVLWAAAKFEIGVLEITPFVLTRIMDETEQEEQTNY